MVLRSPLYLFPDRLPISIEANPIEYWFFEPAEYTRVDSLPISFHCTHFPLHLGIGTSSTHSTINTANALSKVVSSMCHHLVLRNATLASKPEKFT